VDANNLLIAYPSAEDGHAELFLVRHGRLVEQRRAPASYETLREEVGALLGTAERLGPPPDRVGKAEVDQINIIARWIHHHSDDDTRNFFRLPRNPREGDAAEMFVDHAARTIAVEMADPLAESDALESDEIAMTVPVPDPGE